MQSVFDIEFVIAEIAQLQNRFLWSGTIIRKIK